VLADAQEHAGVLAIDRTIRYGIDHTAGIQPADSVDRLPVIAASRRSAAGTPDGTTRFKPVVEPLADLYPSQTPDADVTAQSWVRASHAEFDVPLADAVAAWLAAEWPWERVHRPGR